MTNQIGGQYNQYAPLMTRNNMRSNGNYNNYQIAGGSGFNQGPVSAYGNLFSGLVGQMPGYGYPAGGYQQSIPNGYGGYAGGGPLIIQGGAETAVKKVNRISRFSVAMACLVAHCSSRAVVEIAARKANRI